MLMSLAQSKAQLQACKPASPSRHLSSLPASPSSTFGRTRTVKRGPLCTPLHAQSTTQGLECDGSILACITSTLHCLCCCREIHLFN